MAFSLSKDMADLMEQLDEHQQEQFAKELATKVEELETMPGPMLCEVAEVIDAWRISAALAAHPDWRTQMAEPIDPEDVGTTEDIRNALNA